MLQTEQAMHAFPQTAVVAVSTDVGMYIKYVGPQGSGTVTVAAGGDMTLQHGVLGSEAVDTTVGVSGVFDLSTPGTYTNFGLLVDAINQSPNWIAVLGGVLRADSTDNTLITQAEAQAKLDGGLKLLKDSTTALTIGMSITKQTVDGGSNAGYQFALDSIRMIATNTCSGALTMLVVVYSRNEETGTDTYLDEFVYVSATERIIDHNDWGGGKDGRIWGKEGESLVVQITGGTGGTVTMTVPTLVCRPFFKVIGEGMLTAGHFKSDR